MNNADDPISIAMQLAVDYWWMIIGVAAVAYLCFRVGRGIVNTIKRHNENKRQPFGYDMLNRNTLSGSPREHGAKY